MSRSLRSSFALLTLTVVACGGATKPPASPDGAAPKTAAATAARSARVPSAEIARYIPYDQFAFALYADLGGLLHTELGNAIVPAALSIAGTSLTTEQQRCIEGATANVKDGVLAANANDDAIMVLRYDDQAFDVAPCFIAGSGKPMQLEGAARAFSAGEGIVALVPGALIAGEKEQVKAALATHKPAVLPPDIKLGQDEYLVWSGKFDAQTSAHGSLLETSKRFRIALDADVPAADAEEAERDFKGIKESGTLPGMDAESAKVFAGLLKSFTLTRAGGHLSGAFELNEPVQDQARDIGTVASLATYGVRKYMQNAKIAEARIATLQIAKSYAGYLGESASKPGAKLKLVSFPAVPKKIPSGAKYQTQPSEWKAWEPLHFAFTDPQYYQYEVRAAKDGKSADIIARGDLNGDGKSSEFRLHLALDKEQLTIDPELEEHDAEE